MGYKSFEYTDINKATLTLLSLFQVPLDFQNTTGYLESLRFRAGE